jgi:Flp pilus assembly protein TadD
MHGLVLGLLLAALSAAQMQEITTLLQRGRMADALKMLEPLAKKDPNDPVVAGLLGRARLHAGDAAGAIEPLMRSLSKLKSDGEGFGNLGVALMQVERTQDAAQAFAQAVVLMPRSPQAWRNLAGAYTNLERQIDASKAWKRYLGFRPQDGEARCIYGGLLLAMKRYRDAAVHLRFGSKTTKDVVCLHDYADVLGRLKNPKEALAILDRLIRLDQRNAHAFYLRAYILIDGGIEQADQALKALSTSLKISPKRAASHHLNGYILAQLNRHEEALKSYTRASDLEPKNQRYQEAEAIARVHVGEGDKVLKALQLMLRRSPGNEDLRRALAHVYMGKKQWPKAERVLKGAPTNSAEIRRDLAVVSLSSGRTDQAVSILKKLRSEQPKNRVVAYNLALALRHSGAMKEAYLQAKQARQMPGNTEDELLLETRLLLELGRAQEALTLLNSQRASVSYELLFVRARCLRMQARLPEALKASKQAESEARDDDQRLAVRRLRGKILTDLGRSAEAIGLFRERGSNPAELGIALSRAGRAKEAIKVLKAAQKQQPADVEVQLAFAASLSALGKKQLALKVLTKARQTWPRHGGLTNDTAMAWLAAGKRTRAVALLKQGLKENPEHSALARNYAHHLMATKRRGQAVELLRQTIGRRPHDGQLHTALGETLMSLKRNEEARAAFRQGLEAGTPDPVAEARLGDLLRREGKLKEAVTSYQRALALQPSMLEAHNGMGMALHGLERFDAAIAQYRKGLVHSPHDAELHNNLGSSLYLKGQFAAALTSFERAGKVDPLELSYWRNQLMILKEQGRLEDAQKRLDKALSFLPNHASLKNEQLSLNRAKAMRDRLRATPNNAAPRPDTTPRSR